MLGLASRDWTLDSFVLLAGATLKIFKSPEERGRAVLLLCLAALIAQLLIIGLRGVAAGRYLFPILPAAATLLAVGAAAVSPARVRRHVISCLVIVFIVFDAVFLWRGLLVEQYLVWGS